MGKIKERLTGCFEAVFPNLSKEEISRAAMASIAEWDSTAMVNLWGVIEEEFSIELAMEDIENMISFDLISDLLRRYNIED